jgi:glycosyltransferase involved in cell wall biosynthesis
MQKILVISAYDSSFVLQDIKILGSFGKTRQLLKRKSAILSEVFFLMKLMFNLLWCDAVYCWFADSISYYTAVLAKIIRRKVIIVVGGYEVSDLAGYGGLQSRSAKRIITALKRADQILAVSEFSSNEIRKIVPSSKIIVVPLGVEPENVRHKKEKIIATSGSATSNLFKIKGLDIFAAATKDLNQYQIFVIGKYDEETRNSLLLINPDLIFAGAVSHNEFLQFLQKTEIYCQFSRRESFGYAVLEAMNLGCKIVVSNQPALRELVTSDTCCSEPDNIPSASKNLKNAINSSSPDYYKWISDNFSVSLRAQKLKQIFSELL